jgi:hypothetical protein
MNHLKSWRPTDVKTYTYVMFSQSLCQSLNLQPQFRTSLSRILACKICANLWIYHQATNLDMDPSFHINVLANLLSRFSSQALS